MTAPQVLRGQGGQFAGSVAQGAAKSSTRRRRRPRPVPSGVMAYDRRTGVGTGYGMRHGDPRVRLLQRALNRLGVKDSAGHPLVVDGKLGPKTTSAVMVVQKALGLKPDGRVTPQLLAQIRAVKVPRKKRARHVMSRRRQPHP